jgi:biopolymer transport protein ExbD
MRARFSLLAPATLCIVASLLSACTSNPAADSEASGNASSVVDPIVNKITITSESEIRWNGEPITFEDLKANLKRSTTLSPEPELQFVPDPQANYDLAAKVLNAAKDAGVTKFGFVGNEKCRTPCEDTGAANSTPSSD